MAREYDITVFGATGYTGKRIAKMLSEKCQDECKIAIAGRNVGKLEKVRETMNENSPISIVKADVANEDSINEMAQKSVLVINCVGPYRYTGEQIVKSCVENGAHYMDISGEPEFMEKMELLYNEKAKENNCFIISGVGFDSIPADLGCIFTQNAFPASTVPAYVESFLTIQGNAHGHYATYESAIMGLSNVNELKSIRKKSGSRKVPLVGNYHGRRVKPFYNKERKAHSIPFPGSDPSVVNRTQHFLHKKGITATRYRSFFDVKSTRTYYTLGLAAAVASTFTKYKFTRDLMLKYPSFFTAGGFSHAGPSEEQLMETTFSMEFTGKGFSDESKIEDGNEPDTTIKVKVSGPEPGYVACTIIMTEAALCFLKNIDSIKSFVDGNGGVLTTGSAFYATDLIERLNANGVKFEVVESF